VENPRIADKTKAKSKAPPSQTEDGAPKFVLGFIARAIRPLREGTKGVLEEKRMLPMYSVRCVTHGSGPDRKEVARQEGFEPPTLSSGG
jgi:hypothetical protein